MSDTKGLGYVDAKLNEVEAWDGAISSINPGEYHFKCTKVEGGQSNAGKPKMVLHYEVIAAVGERAEDNADQVGRTVIQSQSLDLTNDTVRGRLANIVKAMLGGWDKRGGFDPAAFEGAEMVAEAVAQEYTKANPLTQEPDTKTSIKLVRERSVDDYYGDEPAEEEPAESAPPARGNAASNRGRGRRSAAPAR